MIRAVWAVVAAILSIVEATSPKIEDTPKPHLVVVFATTIDDPLAARIAAELEAMHFDVRRSPIPLDVAIEEVVDQALAAGARAAVVADGRRAEAWIAEPGTSRVALRQEIEVLNLRGLESILSLKTVEILRVEMGLASPPVPIVAQPATQPPPLLATGERLSFAASGGALFSTGRLGTATIVGATIGARLTSILGAEICGYGPLAAATLSDSGAVVRASVWLAGAGVTLTPLARGRIQLQTGVGGMAALLHVVGTTNPSGAVRTDDALGAAIYARGALGVRVYRQLRLRLDILGGSAIRRPTISRAGMIDHDITAWGKAFGMVLGALEIAF